MFRLSVLLPLLLLLGCDNFAEPRSTGGLALIPVESAYERGEVAEARLVNGSDGAVGYNLCLVMWDLRVDGQWQRVVPLRMCPQAVYVLAPGAEVLLQETIDDSWQPGTYRFVLDVHPVGREGRSITVISDPFEVAE